MAKQSNPQWLPLESNPDMLNTFLAKLGAKGDLQFGDVFGFDPELLAMVPQPTRAAMLLFPISKASEKHKAEEAARLAEAGAAEPPKDLFFMEQKVGNACGTIALVHAVANLRDSFQLEDGKFFANFLSGAADLSPSERAGALGESKDLEESHEEAAREGSSAIPQNVNLHFVCFVRGSDGVLYELDGRKKGPVAHGKTEPEALLADVVRVTREFMARDPDNVNFNLIALGPPME